MKLHYQLKDILHEDGIIDRIDAVVGERLPQARRTKMRVDPAYAAELFFSWVVESVPKGYFLQIKDRVNALKGDTYSDGEEMDEAKLRAEDVDGHIDNQSLYHRVNDRRLLQIIKDGEFKNLGENPLGPDSTGRFEQKVGADGIFCTYGYEYSFIEDDPNVVIFPADYLDRLDTLCIQIELSRLNWSQSKKEGIDSGVCEKFWEIAERFGYSLDKLPHKYSAQEVVQYLTSGLILAMANITSSKVIRLDTNKLMDESEVCIQPRNIIPQCIIVSEEPEYFREEVVGGPFEEVPIIDQTTIDGVIGRIFPDKCIDDEDSRRYFVLGMNKGIIDVEAVVKEREGK
ncbi:MAG: hypothetical protein ABIH82_02865 [Candidatus Woesearchaeota archaeon]|nr:hypothetical protein [Nanoarchaeota archaeon]